jgi:hypothetical protein
MKKTLFPALGLTLILSACMPAFLQPTASPVPQVDLNATAAVLVQGSLEAFPTPTLAPTNTPVVITATNTDTAVLVTPSETQNSLLLTLTATLGTGTVTGDLPGLSTTPTITPTGTLPTPTPSATANPAVSLTPSTTLHPQHYGTMPPDLPSGKITLINKSKTEAYISLQCTTKDGYTTIIEYPVEGWMEVKVPSGRYIYVAWVGGRQMSGNFKLSTAGELTIRIYKDKIEVGK